MFETSLLTKLLLSAVLMAKFTVCQDKIDFNSTMDGFTFLNQKGTTYEMLKRTYNPPGGLNETLCPFIHDFYFPAADHKLWKFIYYVNMSHLDPYSPKNGSCEPSWGMLTATLYFFQENSTEYNWMNSTCLSRPQYRLPSPVWRFLYTLQNCTVVQVLSLAKDKSDKASCAADASPVTGMNDKPHCELWRTKPPNDVDWKTFHPGVCCEAFFNMTCNTTTVYDVYKPEICFSIVPNRTC